MPPINALPTSWLAVSVRCLWAGRRCISKDCCLALIPVQQPTGTFVDRGTRPGSIRCRSVASEIATSRPTDSASRTSDRRTPRHPALDVAYLTGVPLSHRQTQFERIAADQPTATLVSISWPRELLHQRIEQRVSQMFQNGLIDEVRGLLATYQTLSRTAAARWVTEKCWSILTINCRWTRRSIRCCITRVSWRGDKKLGCAACLSARLDAQ